VARKLGVPLRLAPAGALCCGRKLGEGGHPELHEAHAGRVRSAIVRGRAPVHLVFLDPGCARDVQEGWTLPQGSRVEHVSTYLARLLVAMPESDRPPPLPIAVTFHDPCALARGLRETVAPRALLAAAVAELRDPPRCGVDTSCCGASGLLPATMPEVARRIASERRDELGGDAVTSNPACAAALGATEIVSLLARWLAQGVN
jgi:Fe-S oxidoreductase